MATRKQQPVKANAKPAAASARKPHPLAARMAVTRLPRHGALLSAAAVGVVTFIVMLWFNAAFALVGGAIAMFLVYLGLTALIMPALSGEYLRSRADDADAPTGVIFAVVIAVVLLCCGTLFMALRNKNGLVGVGIGLSIASVLLGWFVIHTMAAMHYAYEYYETKPGHPGGGSVGGLDFESGEQPDGMAFLYFAYVIGVAFAVSDVQVSSPKMRKLVMIHSVFSYFFNTLIVAATVNVAVAVGGG
ncbi:DUF1345 domain-containing protein [Devosia sp.]|uniref:DUF1345 domain-containing protein n=1 Tax=Devosia sp. TaxID=1871048 RepID=UPI003263D6D6